MQKEISKIKTAISDVIGVTPEELASVCKERDMFYARMLFAHYCVEVSIPKKTICKELNRNISTVGYYLSKYPFEIKHNAEFRYLENKVRSKIN